MAKAAIIIPAYNVENYIHRAIESALSQSESDIEVIVIDDGSTDRTSEVAAACGKDDPRFRLYWQENTGVSGARNHGLQLATADWVLFLDSDDWMESNAVEQLLALQREAPEKLTCVEPYYAYFQDSEDIRREQQGLGEQKETRNREQALLTVGGTTKFHLTSSCYKLFSRRIIDEQNLMFREDIHYGEDGLFVFQYLNCVDGVSYTPIPLWNILERPGSATTSPFSSKWLTMITAVQTMLSIEGLSSAVKSNLEVYMANWALTLAIIGLRSGTIKDDELELLRGILSERWGLWKKTGISMKRHFQAKVILQWPRSVTEWMLKLRRKT